MMKKLLIVLLTLTLLFTFAGCGAKEMATEDSRVTGSSRYDYDYGFDMKAEAPEAAPEAEEWFEEPMKMESDTVMTGTGSADTSNTQETSAEKIIYSAWVSMESTQFDIATETIESMISKFGGYIQSSSVDGDTRYNTDGTSTVVNRYANYSIAVPSQEFERFLTEAGNAGNVISLSRNAENITSAYTDTEARIKSLRVQEERLMAMMETTGDLESLIELEARLAEVTYEIESFQRKLSNWDRRVAYSTIDISIREVSVYTPTVTVTRTFGEKLADAFADGWRSLTRGAENFVLWFAESIFGLIIWAAVITGAVLVFKRLRKRSAAKKAARAAKNAEAANNAPSANDFPPPPANDFPPPPANP